MTPDLADTLAAYRATQAAEAERLAILRAVLAAETATARRLAQQAIDLLDAIGAAA